MSSQSLGMSLTHKLILTLPYESSGDLELFSLHRIRNRINTLHVDNDVRKQLTNAIVLENSRYKESSGKNWSCITPNGLDNAVDATTTYLREAVRPSLTTVDDSTLRNIMTKIFDKKIDETDGKIRTWFSTNYDNLLYDTSGHIPWPIVQRMRNSLRVWATRTANPFSQPIEDMIAETASELGIRFDADEPDYDDLWNRMKQYK